MHVEWQGDHKMLGADVKQDFERQLSELGFEPSKFLVEVRREPAVKAADKPHAIAYDVFITDLAHPERDTWKLHGGSSENWIEQFKKVVRSHR